MSNITIADFKKCELKTARILDAEEIPGADRLWKITVDTGSGTKVIVSGIKTFYPRETLPGKTIILLNNLEPAVLRGVESQGMLLAANDGANLALLTLDKDLPPGSIIS